MTRRAPKLKAVKARALAYLDGTILLSRINPSREIVDDERELINRKRSRQIMKTVRVLITPIPKRKKP